MAYCRFSSMNWMCDVYVYEDVSCGWTTHVARNRLRFPPLPDLQWRSFGAIVDMTQRPPKVSYPSPWRFWAAGAFAWVWCQWHSLSMFTVERMPRRKLTMEGAGETFSDGSPGQCAERLIELRRRGFNVPIGVINALADEELDNAIESLAAAVVAQ